MKDNVYSLLGNVEQVQFWNGYIKALETVKGE